MAIDKMKVRIESWDKRRNVSVRIRGSLIDFAVKKNVNLSAQIEEYLETVFIPHGYMPPYQPDPDGREPIATDYAGNAYYSIKDMPEDMREAYEKEVNT